MPVQGGQANRRMKKKPRHTPAAMMAGLNMNLEKPDSETVSGK
jgi:hypothetical protein